jgi:hypothetical protein
MLRAMLKANRAGRMATASELAAAGDCGSGQVANTLGLALRSGLVVRPSRSGYVITEKGERAIA